MTRIKHNTQNVDCRICGGEVRTTRVSEPIEHRRERPVLPSDRYTLGVCKNCGLAQITFDVEQSYLDEAYTAESEALILEITGRAPSELSEARTPEFQRVLDLVAQFLSPQSVEGRRLLDIGCQDGRLLALARERGFSVAGLEPSTEYAAAARLRLPEADIVNGVLGDSAMATPADVVVFLETLEHIADPRAALANVRALAVPALASALLLWRSVPRSLPAVVS